MAACTFWGHRDCPDTVAPALKDVLTDLIVHRGVDLFYVGNQGQFDALVRRVLKALRQEYPHIRYAVVLAYMPGSRTADADFSDTMLPEGLEAVHPRHAISWRNNWMLSHADFVVAYITHTWGGAAQYVQKGLRAGKRVINLADAPLGQGPEAHSPTESR